MANYKTIPDPHFRSFLQAELPQAFNEQGQLDIVHDAVYKTIELDLPPGDIASLAGIEYFPSLKGLVCEKNKLEKLDLRETPTLSRLWCAGNQLHTLLVSQNAHLQTLDCSNNALRELNLNENIGLRLLHCQQNNLSHLDLTEAKSLIWLTISASENIDGIVKNPLHTLKINQAICQHPEILQTKKNSPRTVIAVYGGNASLLCTNYDPLQNKCLQKQPLRHSIR